MKLVEAKRLKCIRKSCCFAISARQQSSMTVRACAPAWPPPDARAHFCGRGITDTARIDPRKFEYPSVLAHCICLITCSTVRSQTQRLLCTVRRG